MVKIRLITDRENYSRLTVKQFLNPEFIFLNLGLIFYYGKIEEGNSVNDSVQYHQGKYPDALLLFRVGTFMKLLGRML
jgi:hypothetical protein